MNGIKISDKINKMDPYSTIPHPGHVTGHQRGGGDTPTTIQFLTTRYMKVILASISCDPNLSVYYIQI